MIALFDKNSHLRAWLNDDADCLFDTGMKYIAYIRDGHAWRPTNSHWLGPVLGATVLDRSGRPVLWNPETPIQSTGLPTIPAMPPMPAMPTTPPTPAMPPVPAMPTSPTGGWSSLSFLEWLGQ